MSNSKQTESLYSPQDLGFRQESWRPGQLSAISSLVRAPTRFSGVSAPTGFGKSLVYLAAAKSLPGRTVVLTSTKALQDQLLTDVPAASLVKGRTEFSCLYHGGSHTAESGVCRIGRKCSYKALECPYWDQIRRAERSPLVITNYALWLSQRRDDLGDFTLLICDEAHTGTDWLDEALTIRLRTRTVGSDIPDGEDPTAIAEWARVSLEYMGKPDTGNPSAISRYVRAKAVLEAASTASRDRWVAENVHGGVDLAPIWSGSAQGKTLLFGDVPQVVLTSATLTRKTCELLGVVPGELTWNEYEHGTPRRNRLLMWIPTVTVNHRTTDSQYREWVSRIDQIIDSRLDRKGVIHTVSYRRAGYIQQWSRFASQMIFHPAGQSAAAVREFLSSSPPAILVSPAVGEGVDLPDDLCRYQIIGKIPYPFTNSKVVKARMERDKGYAAYLAMGALVQACGRGVRSADDWCENFLVDDSAQWFMRVNKGYAPAWFMDAYEPSQFVPTARED